MSPVVAGLILAVPIAALTSRPSIGRRLRAMGLLLTPEERAPPPVLVRANQLATAATPEAAVADPVSQLARDAALLDAHYRMLPAPEARRRGDVDVELVVALAKIEEADNLREAIDMLNVKETLVVLASHKALARLLAKRDDGPERVTASDVQGASIPIRLQQADV
jgi:membrane glycosyltransferase